MDCQVHIAIVVPVYNQAGRLREVIERCLEQIPHVWVIDDGSDEPVTDCLAGLAVQVLRHEKNRGKGAALRTGAQHLAAQGYTHMITLDADGQHYPEDVPGFFEAINAHPLALILGVRDFGEANVPKSSRFGRSFGNFWVWVQTGQRVGDIQSGYRAYPLALFKQLPFLSRRYGLEVEIVVRALWGGAEVHAIPVRVFYAPAGQRCSHFHKLYDNLRVSLLNTHLTFRALTPWPHHRVEQGKVRVTALHPLRSIRVLLTERAQPHELGWAVALGLFIGALPIFGIHTVSILVAAALLRLNRLAAVAASQLCMPPIVPLICIEMGHFLRTGGYLTLADLKVLRDMSFMDFGHMGLLRLWEWFLGSLIVGPVMAAILGGMTYVTALEIKRRRSNP